MKKINKKIVSIDGLAQEMRAGFKETRNAIGELREAIVETNKTIENLALATKKGFDEIRKTSDERFRLHSDEFDRVRSDIRDIKSTLGPLVRISAQQDNDISDLRIRLNTVERKVGIEK